MKKSSENTRRLFELDVDVENNIRMPTNEFVALSLGQIAPGSIHLSQGRNRSPIIDVIERVSDTRRWAISSDRKEGDFQVIIDGTRKNWALFQEQTCHWTLRIFQDSFVHELHDSPGPRKIQRLHLGPAGGGWISYMHGPITDVLQDASFHAEIFDRRTDTQVSTEGMVDGEATLELEGLQIFGAHVMIPHLPHPVARIR